MPAYRNKRGPNKGTRFQGKGWRDPCGGGLYFQLKRATFSRGHEVSPYETMEHVIDSLISKSRTISKQSLIDRALTCVSAMSKTSILLWTRVWNLRSSSERKQALEPSNERAFNVFDGGETVYVKIMDEGTEYVQGYTPGGGQWEVKVRGKKPKAEDVIATYGLGEAHRLGLMK